MITRLPIGLAPNYLPPTLTATSQAHATPHRFRVINSTMGYAITIATNDVNRNIVPTNPLSYEESLERHSLLASIFFKYDIRDINSNYINDYLQLDRTSINLLSQLPDLIKSLFGDVLVAIKSLDPIYVGDQLLEVKIATELELNDEFDRNENALFKRINELYLSEALCYIVITYA